VACRHRTTRWLLRAGAALAIALVALSRVALQAHWPLDTAGGFTLALACVAAAVWWHEARPPGAGPAGRAPLRGRVRRGGTSPADRAARGARRRQRRITLGQPARAAVALRVSMRTGADRAIAGQS
jgi:membrane-associated phospholipid phosphatase